MAARAKSRRACGPSFVFLARPRSCEALKSPRNATGIAMTNLHRSPPMNESKTDLGIVNESQFLRLGIRGSFISGEIQRLGCCSSIEGGAALLLESTGDELARSWM